MNKKDTNQGGRWDQGCEFWEALVPILPQDAQVKSLNSHLQFGPLVVKGGHSSEWVSKNFWLLWWFLLGEIWPCPASLWLRKACCSWLVLWALFLALVHTCLCTFGLPSLLLCNKRRGASGTPPSGANLVGEGGCKKSHSHCRCPMSSSLPGRSRAGFHCGFCGIFLPPLHRPTSV